MQEAELSMERRLGTSVANLLVVQNNLASTYDLVGQKERASNMFRDVYSGR